MQTVRERTPPVITKDTAAFWTGGADGELRICRCRSCGWWLHPPQPVCRSCRSRDVAPDVTSGRGTVWSFTVSRYRWSASIQPPYVVAEVELEEQAGLRLLTAIVDCAEVHMGMPVSVRFERAGDAWVPVFAP